MIETECPDAVVATTPLSIFGGLAAVALGTFLARGFGTPLVSWAWPILFVGLGAAFLIASAQPGGITFLIVGVLFVAMGLVPLVLEVRASVQQSAARNDERRRCEIPGRARAAGRRSCSSAAGTGRSRTTASPRRAGDWTLALGIAIVAIGLGIYLATQLFAALGG